MLTIRTSGAGEAEAGKRLEKIGTESTAAIETRREALALRKERLVAAGRSDDVVRVIGLLLDVARDDAERVALRSEASALLAEAGRPGDAVAHAAEWLVLEPTSKVRDGLRKLVLDSKEYGRYADALVRAAERAATRELRVEFLLQAGQSEATALSAPAPAH